MAHQLDFLKKEHILQALEKIDKGTVPKDNEWSEYWINHENKLYQFKYTVAVASSFTNTPIKTTDFTSNVSSRNYIADLGFHIIFKSHKAQRKEVNYWVAASYYGNPGTFIPMLKDFKQDNYWRTDHDLDSKEGAKVYKDLKRVRINDRICIRYFDKKGGKIEIVNLGTIIETNKIDDGRLEVKWDYNPPRYQGEKPSGTGAGNWWRTFFQLTRHSDIKRIFSENLIERRVARITWNDNGWIMPSGPYGKSVYKGSYEEVNGFGHEEWLFDTSKLINGFHYGFLEPISKQHNAYSGNVYDVWLFCINGETKARFWVGEIKNLIVIDEDEAKKIKQVYSEKEWMKEMGEQIKAIGSNAKQFLKTSEINVFNVKFRPHDLYVNDPYFELPDDHPIKELSRYSFANFKDKYEAETELIEDTFVFIPPKGNGNYKDGEHTLGRSTHTRQPKEVEMALWHQLISKLLTQMLEKKHGKKKVRAEHPAGYGANRIDIVVQHTNYLTFYEIKTYNSLKTSIREAFGQIMEYCFYPNQQKAKELIIVSHLPADSNTRKYMQHLRDTFNIPVYYQSFDIENKSISEKC